MDKRAGSRQNPGLVILKAVFRPRFFFVGKETKLVDPMELPAVFMQPEPDLSNTRAKEIIDGIIRGG